MEIGAKITADIESEKKRFKLVWKRITTFFQKGEKYTITFSPKKIELITGGAVNFSIEYKRGPNHKMRSKGFWIEK
jgi:hypothetical protein